MRISEREQQENGEICREKAAMLLTKAEREGFPRQEELQRMYGESVLKEIERVKKAV